MSLLWMDGFDHYGANGTRLAACAIGAYDTLLNNANTVLIAMPLTGGQGMQLSATGGEGYAIIKNFPAPYSSGNVGTGFHMVYTSGTGNTHDVISILTAAGVMLYTIRLDQNSGKLTIINAAGTTLATSSGNLLGGVYYHFECKMVIAGSSGGSIDVRIGGVSFVAATGITTNGTAVGGIGYDQRVAGSAPCLYNLDNLYQWDSLGSINNDWIGERQVYTSLPSADTATADWTKSTGSNGYDLINDVPGVDARYLDAAASGNVSIFDTTNVAPAGLSVVAVMTVVRAMKTDAGAGTLDFGPVHGGVPSLASKAQTNGQSLYCAKMDEVNPSTSAAWTASEVNAAQIELSRSA